jgi:hypothetical protein
MVSYVTVSVLLTSESPPLLVAGATTTATLLSWPPFALAYRTQLRRQMNERDSAIRAILTDTLMSYETGASLPPAILGRRCRRPDVSTPGSRQSSTSPPSSVRARATARLSPSIRRARSVTGTGLPSV